LHTVCNYIEFEVSSIILASLVPLTFVLLVIVVVCAGWVGFSCSAFNLYICPPSHLQDAAEKRTATTAISLNTCTRLSYLHHWRLLLWWTSNWYSWLQAFIFVNIYIRWASFYNLLHVEDSRDFILHS